MTKRKPPKAETEPPLPGTSASQETPVLADETRLLELLLEQAPAAMAVLDHMGRVLHLSPSFTRLLGYSREDLQHIEDWWPLAYPDPAYRQEIRAIWERDLAKAQAGGSTLHSGEALVRCKDGHSLWLEGHARFNESKVIVHMVDVSDRKRAELEAQHWAVEAEAARKQTAWLELALDASRAGIWEWEVETGTHYWSPALLRLFGLERAGSLLEPDIPLWETLIHPDDRPGLLMRIREAVTAGQGFQAEYRLQTPNGLRWLLVRGTLIPPEGPRPRRYLGIVMDVTASRELANRLAAAEERWSFALQGAGLGVWDWNIDSGEVFWSKDWLGMLGYAEGELTPTMEVWSGLLHPEDRERVNAYGETFLADPSGRFELEFRLRHRRGQWVDILSRATLARDAEGQVVRPRRLVGTHLDITERKALQRSLQAAGLRYEAMRETNPGGFCVLSPAGRILEVNDTYCRQTGYSRAELERLSVPDLEATESREQAEAHLHQIVAGKADRFETRQRRKDGQLWHVEVTASYSPVEGGRFFCFLHDITARKRDQRLAELRQHLLELLPLGDQDQLLQAALDVAEELTHSQIGFLHVILPEQQEVSLQVWSSRTLAEMCFAEGHGRHYPVSEAGVWTDCIHQRRPVIHNSYRILPHRKGLPEGHAPLVREATVPLVIDGRVLAVIGVGNKTCDYTNEDLDLLRQVIEMAMDFAERLKVGQRLEYVAFYDVLTGLPNRTLLVDRLTQAIPQSARSGQMLAIGHLNLDAFKPINDRLGRQIGDAVLAQLGQRLQDSLRQGDSVARVGGDDLVLILTGLDSPHEGLEAAQRMLEVINQPIEVRGHRLHLSASMGLTLYPTDSGGPDALLHHAQEAMYQAKSYRRGGYHLGDFLARTLADDPTHAGTGLEIEILEADEIRDPQVAARVMSACKALGCTFSLDDFGTGFASLTYLHQLPIDKVKIDQRFVRNLLDNPKDLAIVEGVLQMARVLPWPVLAEGIESLEVGFLLHQLGCHDGQGFAIARPMPPEMIPVWLESWAEERRWHGLAAATATGVAPVLGVAVFSLRHWLDDILVYLRGDKGRTLPPLDQHQCQFCRWYHGIGDVRYGARPRYAFIQARHHSLHALALELVNEADADPTRITQRRISQLEALGEELVELLWGLGH